MTSTSPICRVCILISRATGAADPGRRHQRTEPRPGDLPAVGGFDGVAAEIRIGGVAAEQQVVGDRCRVPVDRHTRHRDADAAHGLSGRGVLRNRVLEPFGIVDVGRFVLVRCDAVERNRVGDDDLASTSGSSPSTMPDASVVVVVGAAVVVVASVVVVVASVVVVAAAVVVVVSTTSASAAAPPHALATSARARSSVVSRFMVSSLVSGGFWGARACSTASREVGVANNARLVSEAGPILRPVGPGGRRGDGSPTDTTTSQSWRGVWSEPHRGPGSARVVVRPDRSYPAYTASRKDPIE